MLIFKFRGAVYLMSYKANKIKLYLICIHEFKHPSNERLAFPSIISCQSKTLCWTVLNIS